MQFPSRFNEIFWRKRRWKPIRVQFSPAYAGFFCLLALHGSTLNAVGFAAFDKAVSRAAKGEADVVAAAFLAELLHPFIAAGSCAAVVFTVAQHLLDLPCGEVLREADRADERRAHNPLVLKRQLQQQRYALIGAALVFTRDIEHHMLPTLLAPIGRQARCHAVRALGEQEKFHIGALPDDVPSLRAPVICLLQKEVACHANAQHLAAFDLVMPAFVLRERVAKARTRAVNVAAVLAMLCIEKEHIAIFAALAALHAAVPRVPNIVHMRSLLGRFSFSIIPHFCADASRHFSVTRYAGGYGGAGKRQNDVGAVRKIMKSFARQKMKSGFAR